MTFSQRRCRNLMNLATQSFLSPKLLLFSRTRWEPHNLVSWCGRSNYVTAMQKFFIDSTNSSFWMNLTFRRFAKLFLSRDSKHHEGNFWGNVSTWKSLKPLEILNDWSQWSYSCKGLPRHLQWYIASWQELLGGASNPSFLADMWIGIFGLCIGKWGHKLEF